jgi:hypothetical protein
VKKCRWQEIVVRNSGSLETKYAFKLKPSGSFVNCCFFVPTFGEFFKMKFGDFSVRMVVHQVCCLLMTVRIDGFEHSSVKGCRVCVVWGGRHNISMPFLEHFREEWKLFHSISVDINL